MTQKQSIFIKFSDNRIVFLSVCDFKLTAWILEEDGSFFPMCSISRSCLHQKTVKEVVRASSLDHA